MEDDRKISLTRQRVKDIQKKNEETPITLAVGAIIIVFLFGNLGEGGIIASLLSEETSIGIMIISFPIALVLQFILESRSEKNLGDDYVRVKEEIIAEKRINLEQAKAEEKRSLEHFWSSSRRMAKEGSQSEPRRCRQPGCSNRVMGGSNYSRQSYCENCLLIWDGDD